MKTILVVDDYSTIREFVCETLQRKGYQTVGVSTEKDALAKLTDNNFTIDLVLSDYNMPDGTGFELLTKIKKNPTVASVPVVFLTTESDPEKMRKAREAGLNAWIKKPYRAETFFSVIEKAFRPIA